MTSELHEHTRFELGDARYVYSAEHNSDTGCFECLLWRWTFGTGTAAA